MRPAQRPTDALQLAQPASGASAGVRPDAADALPALRALADAPSAERSAAPELAFLAQAAAALPAQAAALCTPDAVQVCGMIIRGGGATGAASFSGAAGGADTLADILCTGGCPADGAAGGIIRGGIATAGGAALATGAADEAGGAATGVAADGSGATGGFGGMTTTAGCRWAAATDAGVTNLGAGASGAGFGGIGFAGAIGASALASIEGAAGLATGGLITGCATWSAASFAE